MERDLLQAVCFVVGPVQQIPNLESVLCQYCNCFKQFGQRHLSEELAIHRQFFVLLELRLVVLVGLAGLVHLMLAERAHDFNAVIQNIHSFLVEPTQLVEQPNGDDSLLFLFVVRNLR